MKFKLKDDKLKFEVCQSIKQPINIYVVSVIDIVEEYEINVICC